MPRFTVRENVEAWCEEKKLVHRFNEVSMEVGENYTDELMEEMTSLQEKIDASDAWDIDSKIDMAMDALRCPPDDAASPSSPAANAAASRSAACCCRSPTCCCSTNRPTTSTPKASPGCSITSRIFPAA